MGLRSNHLNIKEIKHPFGTFLRQVVKMKMLEIYFALNWAEDQGQGSSFMLTLTIPVILNTLAPTFLR